MKEVLLEIRDLQVRFYTYQGVVKAVDLEHLEIRKGETLGLVGETGCGKTVTSSAILDLVPPPGRIVAGQIIFQGENLVEQPQMGHIRGEKIAMIFQDPMSSLNPLFTIGEQVTRVIRTHTPLDRGQAEERARELLELVELPDPGRTLRKYPHQLSGGQRQRVMIVMALCCRPLLLIADEPTTALDVTIQGQILRLLNQLKEKIQASILLITHDLGVVAQVCDRVAVMYAGNIVEYGQVREIFRQPKHPYTVGLLATIPKPGRRVEALPVIEGSVPNLLNPPSGCRFHPRCRQAMAHCGQEKPLAVQVAGGHGVACFLYGDER